MPPIRTRHRLLLGLLAAAVLMASLFFWHGLHGSAGVQDCVMSGGAICTPAAASGK